MTWQHLWTHDTCKRRDNCNVLLSRPPLKGAHSISSLLFSSPTPSSLSSFLLHIYNNNHNNLVKFFHILDFFLKYMENFIATETEVDLQMRPSRLTSTDDPSSSPSAVESPESMSVEWTDEKHSLYLKSMEASFVNELYDSMELLGWYPEMRHLSHSKQSKQKHTNLHAPPAQFKALRSGSWQKINLERGESQVIKTSETQGGGLLANPWILHFRSAGNTQGVESRGVPQRVGSVNRANDSDRKKAMSRWGPSSSKQFRFCGPRSCHEDLHGSETEVSDQNFVDEDIEGEKSKRAKTVELDPYSSSDQVVPLRKP